MLALSAMLFLPTTTKLQAQPSLSPPIACLSAVPFSSRLAPAAGHLPFEGADKAEVKRSISAGRLRPLPLSLSSTAIDFVVSMLEHDPNRRPSAAELLQHPWVRKHTGPVPVHAGMPISRDDSAYDTEGVEKKVSSMVRRPCLSVACMVQLGPGITSWANGAASLLLC